MKLFGGLLMGCGILIALLFGTCTVIFIGAAIQSPYSSYNTDAYSFMLLAGVLPFLFGIAVAWAGRHIVKNETKHSRADVPAEGPGDTDEPPAP